MSKRQPHPKNRIGVVLPTRMLARIDGLVDIDSGENRSDVVRRALAEFLARKGKTS